MSEHYYDFGTQLERGVYFEQVVRQHLETELKSKVEGTNMDLQRLGIDFIVTGPTGSAMSVEVKTDERAQDTGNAFIETISVEKPDGSIEKLGWIRTSLAQVLIYYIPKLGDLYFIDMPAFKRAAAHWPPGRYPSRRIPNKTYVGTGLLMPLKELREFAFHIRQIPPV